MDNVESVDHAEPSWSFRFPPDIRAYIRASICRVYCSSVLALWLSIFPALCALLRQFLRLLMRV